MQRFVRRIRIERVGARIEFAHDGSRAFGFALRIGLGLRGLGVVRQVLFARHFRGLGFFDQAGLEELLLQGVELGHAAETG